MQLPDLLNNNNLFLNLNGLIQRENESLNQVKDEIFSRGTSALLHLIRIQDLNKNCIAEFSLYENQLINIKDTKIVYSSESLGFLLNEISPLFGTLRMLQNLSIKLLNVLGVNTLPNSINDYMKKSEKHKVEQKLHDKIRVYWESTGEILKHYRDIDQHYKWLFRRYFLQIKGIKTIIIELPDNPETKSPKKFTYSKNINAIDFLNNAFKEIHDLIENIAIEYGGVKTKHNQGLSMDQLGELTPFSNRTISFMYLKYIKPVSGKNTMHLEGIGMDQLDTGKLTIRKYFLDEKNLEQAKRLYGK